MAEFARVTATTRKSNDQDCELIGIYNALFDVSSNPTAQERCAAYRLRYEVYVEETGFLNDQDNPGGLETDRFDARSGHSILIHRMSGTPVGTVRIIPPIADKAGCDLPARMAAPQLNELPESVLPRATTGEISRFSIIKSFRRRMGDSIYGSIHDSHVAGSDPQRIIPHIALGLMTGIFDQIVRFDLTHLCAIVDPLLLRLLRRLGVEFQPVGVPVEFHGMRQPVIASCSDLQDQLSSNRPEIYQVISRDNNLSVTR